MVSSDFLSKVEIWPFRACAKEKESDDVAQIFVDSLRKEVEEIYKFTKKSNELYGNVTNMTYFDREVYVATNICHICEKPFEKMPLLKRKNVIKK